MNKTLLHQIEGGVDIEIQDKYMHMWCYIYLLAFKINWEL